MLAALVVGRRRAEAADRRGPDRRRDQGEGVTFGGSFHVTAPFRCVGSGGRTAMIPVPALEVLVSSVTVHLTAIPCGRAGPPQKAVLKSRLNRGSRLRLFRPTFRTWTLWSPSSWTLPGLARGNRSSTRK